MANAPGSESICRPRPINIKRKYIRFCLLRLDCTGDEVSRREKSASHLSASLSHGCRGSLPPVAPLRNSRVRSKLLVRDLGGKNVDKQVHGSIVKTQQLSHCSYPKLPSAIELIRSSSFGLFTERAKPSREVSDQRHGSGATKNAARRTYQ